MHIVRHGRAALTVPLKQAPTSPTDKMRRETRKYINNKNIAADEHY